jgi:hypothetical protein
MQLVSRIRDALHVTIDLRALFTNPILAQLADVIDVQGAELLSDDERQRIEAEVSRLSEEEIDRLISGGRRGEDSR